MDSLQKRFSKQYCFDTTFIFRKNNLLPRIQSKGFPLFWKFSKKYFRFCEGPESFCSWNQKPKNWKPLWESTVWTCFFLTQHEVSSTFQNGPNQNVRAGPPPVTHVKHFLGVLHFFILCSFTENRSFLNQVFYIFKNLHMCHEGWQKICSHRYFSSILKPPSLFSAAQRKILGIFEQIYQ